VIISQGSQAAVEADEIVEAIKAETERQRREKISEARKAANEEITTEVAAEMLETGLFEADEITQLIAPSKVRKEDNETRTKLATNFNTNRTYINEAARLKQGREKQKETLGGFKYESSVLSIIDRTDEKETHNTQKIIAEIRERSESGTFTRSNNLLLQPIDPNTNAAATNY
jgi:hypothetical protein